MTPVALRTEVDPATGLLRLQVSPGVLDAGERRALEAEVIRRHSKILDADGKVVRLATRTRLAPDGRFRVRVGRDCARLPTLTLSPCRPQGLTLSWRERLLADLREVVGGDVLLGYSTAEAGAFEEAVEGLSRLAEASPGRLALVLLEGYLSLFASRHPDRALARRRLRKSWSCRKNPCKSSNPEASYYRRPRNPASREANDVEG